MSLRHTTVAFNPAILNELLVAAKPGGVCGGTWVGCAGHVEREGTGMKMGMITRMGMSDFGRGMEREMGAQCAAIDIL